MTHRLLNLNQLTEIKDIMVMAIQDTTNQLIIILHLDIPMELEVVVLTSHFVFLRIQKFYCQMEKLSGWMS